MASTAVPQAVNSGDLTDLVSSTGSATIYPSDDAVLAVLQARFRSDLPYTRINTSHLVVVNPYKTLANVNDANAKEYEERCYKDTSLPIGEAARPLPPHLYETAAKIYLVMRRRNESQSVLFRGITGSGKSYSSRLLINQVLRLSAHSKRENKVAEQVKSLTTLLDSFGNAKTLMSPNASRHSRYLELHFNERGRISSAKVLTFGLDKSRLNRLTHEERSYHVFYQLLAGATPEERDRFDFQDPSDYALLASSGCYRLPAGPFSDDAVAMEELRAAMKTLGFKAKHVSAIFSLLVAILLFSNLEFEEGDAHDVSAYVVNTPLLDQISRLLGVPAEELGATLTNKTSYVRKELYTVLLNAQQSAAQRDSFVRDLYAILFAYVVETANHKLAPSSQDPAPTTQIIVFDNPGFQTRGPVGTNSMAFSAAPLVSAYGHNGFDEFAINFADELVHSYVLRNTFEDNVGINGQWTGDGATLPAITTMDNGACVELLRGAPLNERAHRKPGGVLGIMNKACSSFKSGKSSEKKDEDMLQDLVAKFGVHASFVSSPGVGGQATERNLFGINHYAGQCSYDVSAFVEKDTDILDSAFVTLLRSSAEPFVSKLLSGPSLAAERHHQDEGIIVQAQVSSQPLRQPTPIAALDGSFPAPGEEHPRLDPGKVYPVTTQLNYNLSEVFSNIDRTRLWNVSCIRPNDSQSANSFDKRRVKAQIRSLLLPDIVARRQSEFLIDFEKTAFCDRYQSRMQGSDMERIRQCAAANGWREGVDYALGHRMMWLTYGAWKMVEDPLRNAEKEARKALNGGVDEEESVMADDATEYTHQDAGMPPQGGFGDSNDNLLLTRTGADGSHYHVANAGTYGSGGLQTPSVPAFSEADHSAWDNDEWDKKGGPPGGYTPPVQPSEKSGMVVKEAPNTVEEIPTSRSRRIWLWVVWGLTWWIPTFCLSSIGRMKRADVRLAWREKITIFFLIFLLNATVIFYIIEFGRLLCPNFDKAWNSQELSEHQGDQDWWCAVQGRVYDLSNFIHSDHSDIKNYASNSADVLDGLVGQDLTGYFPIPLTLGCEGLVSDDTLQLTSDPDRFQEQFPQAMHTSGYYASDTNSALHSDDWYKNTYRPAIDKYYKGPLVYTTKDVKSEGQNSTSARNWAIWSDQVYDLSDYVYTQSQQSSSSNSLAFLDKSVSNIWTQQPGQDITKELNSVLDGFNDTYREQHVNCIKNMFYIGDIDFRKSPRCQVQNYLLIIFSAVIAASMVLKFLSALQLTPKRNPEMLDKFIICQVPCYTEGEESLRRTLDSLAALKYDDKRKLIFVICDGNIIGSGNDRTTPRIVLDILGVDPKLDPEPLLFKSIGEGSKALNYGKVYSGLYEFEGHVVPYMVIVKVGKPTERSKPGNRGKRDSQILMMQYLNRVHFDAPMSPLELEIYHQMRNVIGIDPAFYEYIFTVDADTTVTPDGLNRLVAAAADDSSIIGICGETKLENEEQSWWTMIQVYEYYISHHLSKAFESLFGSVTCLPGCFSLYRIRTADKGRPIIISNRVIEEYAEPNVDTLHKKNLFSLGEDRFLTTLLMKHFPTFKTKFIPDAVAHTMAPESWRVLFSQRRRWINSTVHNLCELVMLPELFGFCCFSMRFFVFLDLLGTLILPATVVYLIYLIITVSSGKAAIPIVSIIMIAAVYGLQALIFILKREFMLLGWMVVYILSYPVYSFFLPVYSFWCMDEFGWGNTRLVIGEGKDKKVIINDDEKYDDSMIPLKKFSEYEAETWETGTHHSDDTERTGKSGWSRPRSRAPPSRDESPFGDSADYYRDTNKLTGAASSRGGSRLRNEASQGQMSQYGGHPASIYGGAAAVPQLPFMPFGGSQAGGSEYGGAMPAAMPYQHTGSVYGMPPQMSVYGMPAPPAMGPPRNTMMTDFGMLGGGGAGGSQVGGSHGLGMGMQRPVSTFSMATTVNPFGNLSPSMNEDPSEEELFGALRVYLSTQDLMSVTKKTAREAIQARFPKADLSARKEYLNQAIDKILSES